MSGGNGDCILCVFASQQLFPAFLCFTALYGEREREDREREKEREGERERGREREGERERERQRDYRPAGQLTNETVESLAPAIGA